MPGRGPTNRTPNKDKRQPASEGDQDVPAPDDPKAVPHYSGDRYGRADEGKYGGEGWEASEPDEHPDAEEAKSLRPQRTGKPKHGMPPPRRRGRS